MSIREPVLPNDEWVKRMDLIHRLSRQQLIETIVRDYLRNPSIISGTPLSELYAIPTARQA